MDVMQRRRELMAMQKIGPTIVNLCPAATGTEIVEKFSVSNAYRRYMITGLDPNQDYTLQATWTKTWETISNRRLYLNGISTNAMIRPTTEDTVAPFTKSVTTKPSADGTLEIAANNNGLTSVNISGPEYAASMVNIMLEIGSVAHPFVPYVEP